MRRAFSLPNFRTVGDIWFVEPAVAVARAGRGAKDSRCGAKFQLSAVPHTIHGALTFT